MEIEKNWMCFKDFFALYLQDFENVFDSQKTLISNCENYSAFYFLIQKDMKISHFEIRKKLESVMLKHNLTSRFSTFFIENMEKLPQEYTPISWRDYLKNCYNSQDPNVILNLQKNGIIIDSGLQEKILSERKVEIIQMELEIKNNKNLEEIKIYSNEIQKTMNLILILKENTKLDLVK